MTDEDFRSAVLRRLERLEDEMVTVDHRLGKVETASEVAAVLRRALEERLAKIETWLKALFLIAFSTFVGLIATDFWPLISP